MRLQRSQVTWSQLQVGIFALICGIILLWVILFAGNGLKAVQNRFTVQTVIDSASGLKSGDPVRLAGIEVGTIKTVEFVRQNGVEKVRIQLNLNQQAAQRVKSDSIVQIKSVGFTQSRYVDISLGMPQGTPVSEGVTLRGTIPTEMSILLNQAVVVSENMNNSLTRFESLVNRLQSGDGTFARLLSDAALYANLDRATNGVSELVGELNEGNGLLPQLLSKREIAENVTQSTAWVAKWGQQAAQGEGTLGKLSTDPALFNRTERILESLENLEARFNQLDSLIGSTDALIQKIENGEGTASRIINRPDLYDQSVATSQKMEQFIDQVQSGEGTIGKLVSDPSLAKSVTTSTESIAQLTNKLNTPGNTLDKLTSGTELFDHLNATAKQLETVLAKINDGEGSLSKLANDKKTAEELTTLIYNLKVLAGDIEAQPKKYVGFSLF